MAGSRRAVWIWTAAAVALGLACAGARAAEAEAAPAIQPAAAPVAARPLPVAIDAQVSGDGSSTRLSLTTSEPVEPSVKVLEKPDRLVLDLPEVNFQIPAEASRRTKGLVKSFRYGLIGPGRSRVVIELAAPALPAQVANESAANGAANSLVLDIKRADREAFAKAAAADRAPAAEPSVASRGAPGDKRPVVVLDPGHGGIDTGAIGLNHVIEKDVVLAFTRELKGKLEKNGRYRVVITRDDDSFISLRDRVRVAQENGASLFVSIHADTVRASPEVRGLTVYTNSDKASDAEAAQLAESENKSDSVAGVETEASAEEVAGILGDLTRRETRTYSHLFARTLVGKMTAAAKLNKNPQRSAGFWVLRAPDVPSVLIELGYLSSKSDVELLVADAWRDKATDSIATAINAFLAPRLAQQGASSKP